MPRKLRQLRTDLQRMGFLSIIKQEAIKYGSILLSQV